MAFQTPWPSEPKPEETAALKDENAHKQEQSKNDAGRITRLMRKNLRTRKDQIIRGISQEDR